MQNSQHVAISHDYAPVSHPKAHQSVLALQTYDVVGLRRRVIGVSPDLVPETLRTIAGHVGQDLQSRTAVGDFFHCKYVAQGYDVVNNDNARASRNQRRDMSSLADTPGARLQDLELLRVLVQGLGRLEDQEECSG